MDAIKRKTISDKGKAILKNNLSASTKDEEEEGDFQEYNPVFHDDLHPEDDDSEEEGEGGVEKKKKQIARNNQSGILPRGFTAHKLRMGTQSEEDDAGQEIVDARTLDDLERSFRVLGEGGGVAIPLRNKIDSRLIVPAFGNSAELTLRVFRGTMYIICIYIYKADMFFFPGANAITPTFLSFINGHDQTVCR